MAEDDSQYIFGYRIREPFDSEIKYLKANKNVSGMATEDGNIILNPFSGLSSSQKKSVAQNEAVRLWLRKNKIDPPFLPTMEQVDSFRGTPYENDILNLKHTIVGRIISNDPSAGKITPEQKIFADILGKKLRKR